ncbi:MAG TPA: hypothetical protein VJZ71_14375 [Phycisphaerae bacterium]|nr:hypothetical protein [Phycisphaerae bacterium]
MIQTAFECFPWDLDLEGYDDAIARLAGDIGVDALLVPAVHEGIREIRPRAAEADRAFICSAAAHFQPDAKLYSGLQIRPIPAAWMKTRNPLQKIAEAAEKHRLKLRVSISCCQGDTLVERYPHAACADFFGRPSDHWLCPSHPDVRAYLAALVEDITTNYPVDALNLESAHFEPGYTTGYMNSLQLPPAISTLFFDSCYCASCLQRATDAGVDVSALRAVHNGLFMKLSRLEPVPAVEFPDLIAENRVLADFQRTRQESVTLLVHSLWACCKAPLRTALAGPNDSTAAWPEELNKYCDGFYVPVVSSREHEWPSEEIAEAGGPAHCDINFTCYPPWAPDSPTLVSAVHRAAQAGVASIIFDNYGVAPEPCLDWVRQAIRYARREMT